MLNAFWIVFLKVYAEISQHIPGTFAWKAREYFKNNNWEKISATRIFCLFRLDETRLDIFEYFYQKYANKRLKNKADIVAKIFDNTTKN